MLYSTIILAIACPILTIGAFILGWNLNAPMGRKIGKKPMVEPTEDEKTLKFLEEFEV